jgi:hypothetical protein
MTDGRGTISTTQRNAAATWTVSDKWADGTKTSAVQVVQSVTNELGRLLYGKNYRSGDESKSTYNTQKAFKWVRPL